MHGFMRQYWGKKFLEWSKTPEEAIWNCNYLNDRYELDGNDPNGFAGCMWCIAGVHDTAWSERDVIGKIRYIDRKGYEKSFDVARFIKKWNSGHCPQQ